MIDGIIKADGTSRLMRATLPATYEEFKTQAAAGTLPLDVMFNANGWSQFPTFLNKLNLLRDDTASSFGFGAEAVPNDVFSFIGKYNEHWWSVLHGQAYSEYVENLVSVPEGGAMFADSTKRVITYSKNVSVNKTTGAVSLVDPKSFTIQSNSLDSMRELISMAPVYVTNLFSYGVTDVTNMIFYLPAGSGLGSGKTVGYSSGYQFYIVDGGSPAPKRVTSKIVNIPAGETTYEHSTNRNAYPDSGTVNGLTYQYLGVPFEKFPAAPQIATGSYTGTGTYGSGNPNIVTFPFVPKFVYICAQNESAKYILLWVSGARRVPGTIDNGSDFQVVTLSGKTISWYCGYNQGAGQQLNFSGVLYQWIAIG